MPEPASNPDVILRRTENMPQEPLPLVSEGVQRWVWESQFGAMLIEVIGDVPYVNGMRVERTSENPR